MRAISSHRSIKMRVLILSAAIFACATGAPSGAIVAPLSGVVPAIPIPTATVNSGDLQAAIIDAKVQTEDFLRAAAEKTRETTEQVVEDTKDKVIEINDQAKERSLEAFWAGEEKKWQALDAIKTAEARLDGQVASLDGQVASQADAKAKSLVIPSVLTPISPVVAPIPQFYYAPGIIAPTLKAFSTETFIQLPEAPKPEEKKEEPKAEEKPEEIKSDAIKIEAADVKSAEPKPEAPKNELEGKYVVANTNIIPQFPLAGFKIASPWVVSPVALGQHDLKPLAYSTHLLTPTVIKTVW